VVGSPPTSFVKIPFGIHSLGMIPVEILPVSWPLCTELLRIEPHVLSFSPKIALGVESMLNSNYGVLL